MANGMIYGSWAMRVIAIKINHGGTARHGRTLTQALTPFNVSYHTHALLKTSSNLDRDGARIPCIFKKPMTFEPWCSLRGHQNPYQYPKETLTPWLLEPAGSFTKSPGSTCAN